MRWLRLASIIVGALVGLSLLAVGAVLYPYVRDDAALDWTVRAVALDWRDFGRDAAFERLQYELDHQGIGTWVGDDHCALDTLDDGTRRVACRWGVVLPIPATERAVPLHFASTATITRDGQLEASR